MRAWLDVFFKSFGLAHREVDSETAAMLQYYSPAIHRAAFVLPEFARRELA